MSTFAIIIPCYNEDSRLKKNIFSRFLETHLDVKLFFVNDGSTDNTLKIIEEIKHQSINQVQIINLPENIGKGESVRRGMLEAIEQNQFDYIGYLDADLSTSLDEYYELCTHAVHMNADFIFGSRIKKLGSFIKRSFLRHVIGRTVMTIVDQKFKLGYYDTQCGAKLFRAGVLETIIWQSFSTKWFFDIEIFLRLRKKNKDYIGIEYPLKTWHNVGGSKLTLLSFSFVLKEIIILFSKYKNGE